MGILDKLFGRIKSENIEQIKSIKFTTSAELMEEEQFWKIIQTVKNNSLGDYEMYYEELAKQLYTLLPDDIILFANSFRFFRGQANTWELWGAIYIIQGGCGDDSFNDFREWVIGQGKEFYFKTIKDPETLAELDKEFIEETSEFEGFGHIPSSVFKEITGQEMPYPFQENQITSGKEWDEAGDDLKNYFPKIYSKYPYNI